MRVPNPGILWGLEGAGWVDSGPPLPPSVSIAKENRQEHGETSQMVNLNKAAKSEAGTRAVAIHLPLFSSVSKWNPSSRTLTYLDFEPPYHPPWYLSPLLNSQRTHTPPCTPADPEYREPSPGSVKLRYEPMSHDPPSLLSFLPKLLLQCLVLDLCFLRKLPRNIKRPNHSDGNRLIRIRLPEPLTETVP